MYRTQLRARASQALTAPLYSEFVMNTLYNALPRAGRLNRTITREVLETLGLKERFRWVSPQELIEKGHGVITVPYDLCFSPQGDRIRDRKYPYTQRNGIRCAKPDEYAISHNVLLREGERYRVVEDVGGWWRLENLHPNIQKTLQRLEGLPPARVKDDSVCIQTWRELPADALPDVEAPVKGVYPSTLGMGVAHVRQELLLYNTILGEVWWHAPSGAEVGDKCTPYLYSIEFKH